jgi:arylsulfatase A-like enzyme
MTTRDAGAPRARAWLEVAVFASAGAAVGLLSAAREIALQDWLAAGFRRSSVLELRGGSSAGLLVGGLGVVALVALRHNLVAFFRSWQAPLSRAGLLALSSARERAAARAALAAGAGALFVAARALEPGGVTATGAAWAGLVALGAWLLLSATAALARRLLARGRRAAAEALSLATAATFGFLLAAALAHGRPAPEFPGFDLAALAAFGAAGAAVLAILWAGLAPGRPLLRAAALLPLGVAGLAWLPPLARPTLTAAQPRNLVLIGIDTLRFDRTALAPAATPAEAARRARVTPNLAALADEAAVFVNATTQAPWTLPSFASILTGRYPHEHGASALGGWLRSRELGLAEVLREAGYRTAAVVSHVLVARDRGFAQGFERFDESQVLGESAVTSQGVTDAALDWLARDGAGPFFLFLHYFDPHYEYRDHAEWAFADAYRGWLRDEAPAIHEIRHRAAELAPRDLAHLRDLYDEDLAFTDREIGRLLAGLRAAGRAGDTAIVVVGDHGEEFLEHGWLGHELSLYQEVLRVPLLLRLPGVPAAVVEPPVETRALFATLLDYLGIEGVARGSAASLLPLLRGEQAAPAAVFSSVWLPDAPPESGRRVRRAAVRRGDWKLIRDQDTGTERIFDLSRDPHERADLSQTAPARRAELSAALDDWLAGLLEAGPAPARELDPQERERLRALGYL